MADFHDCAVLRAMQTCAPLNCAREETCFRLASFLREHGCQSLADWLQQVAAPLTGSPAPAATPEKPSLLERVRVLFPDDNWQAGDLDLNTMAESARDLCLSLALTLETVRQHYTQASDDGR